MISIKDVSLNDFFAYYSGCFIRDPNTGQPAVIGSLDQVEGGRQRYNPDLDRYVDPPDAEFEVPVYVLTGKTPEKFVKKVTKYRPKLPGPGEVLLNMGYYSCPSLGYRHVMDGNNLVYISRGNSRVAALRGLNHNKVLMEFAGDLSELTGLNEEAYYGDRFKVAFLVFSNDFLTYEVALKRIVEESRNAFALSPSLALRISGESDCDEYPVVLLCDKAVAGKVSLTDGKIHPVKDFEKLLAQSIQVAPFLGESLGG